MQAGEQNRKLEGLWKIVVRPRREAFQDIFRTTARGEHEHGNEVVRGAEFRNNSEAVLAGQHDIEDHGCEIRSGVKHAVNRRLAVAYHLGNIALSLEIEAQPLRQMGLIFDHQNAAQALALGSSRVMVAPRPSPSLWAKTRPPCLRAIALTINRPSPVPLTGERDWLATR